MDKIKLITDSTSDLSIELIKELDVEILPLYVSFEGDLNSYKDGIDISQTELVNKVKETKSLPSTSAVPPQVFLDTFNKYLKEGYKILFTGISSKLSSSCKNANLAKEQSTDPSSIRVVDSLNLSTGIALVLLKARDFIKEGLSLDDVATKLETEVVPNVHSSFCIDTLDYMCKGGRCSALSLTLSKVLSIKPIIIVKDGCLIPGKKPIGTIDMSLRIIYNDLMKEIKNCDLDYCFVTAFLNEKSTESMAALLAKNTKFNHIYKTKAGSVIGSHCGAGTIGILYLLKPTVKE